MDIKASLAGEIAKAVGLDGAEVLDMLETPPDPKMGDAALPCFKLAKTMKMAPPKIAEEIMGKLQKPEYIAEIRVAGGYLNFFYDKTFYVKTVMGEVLAAGTDWGKAKIGAGKTIVIDYSSINIAKPFHIGHLSSTAIGSALYKIYSYLGYDVVGVNHLGDWGTQFGKLITAYKHWGSDDEINKNSVSAMLELYVRLHKEAEQDESLNDEGRAWFKKIEDGDEEALRIFEWFKELTLNEAKRVYDRLDVQFDSYAGESFYNDKVGAVVDELKEKNLLEESDGAYVVRLDEHKLPPAIILKSDGATLYATRDLAAAKYRHQTYDFDKNLYVVAYQQNLHFKQVFAVLEKMGYGWADKCEHVAFGMVSLEDGTLSTREGKVVFLEDVLNAAVEKTLAIINEKSPELENRAAIAEDIGVGAVIYSTLSQSRIKDITFSFDRVLNFDGETGPYLQYCHARCNSVVERAGERNAKMDYSVLENDEAMAVIKLLESFPQVLVSATEKNEPFYVTRHITDLAQACNKYYFEHKIIDDNEEQTNTRVALTKAVRDVLKRGLSLLGIKAPDKM
ncbi:arginine--tRNA ligase [Christensenellaceae bacterium OttesenSCG-928-K19]|nr:arginine--tRNA ligase [Christensenellaceae bacterium OttesenSCG-928-K19]